MRLSNLYLFTLSVVVFRIREFSFFILIQNLERTLSPVFSGSTQDISALLDLTLVTVRFVGLSGNRAVQERRKSKCKTELLYKISSVSLIHLMNSLSSFIGRINVTY